MQLGGDAEKRWCFTSAADFVLDVDETTRFRDSSEAAASPPSPATHFHLLSIWPITHYSIYLKLSLVYH